jgi:hypothetical protein
MEGAADPVQGLFAKDTRCVCLADAESDIHVSCLHFGAGAEAAMPATTHY